MKLPIVTPLLEFLHETKVELSLVNWPNRQETLRLTYLVIAVSIITGVYLGAIDTGFTSLFAKILSK